MERKPKRNHGLNNGAFLYHLQNTLNISWTERQKWEKTKDKADKEKEKRKGVKGKEQVK